MKKFYALAGAALITVGSIGYCNQYSSKMAFAQNFNKGAAVVQKQVVDVRTQGTKHKMKSDEKSTKKDERKPKYVFMFIGDGMSYPQIQSSNYYLNALKNKTSMGDKEKKTVLKKDEDVIKFIGFPVAGSARTYDSTSFCPDSASTATAMSTGHKTYSGTINMNENATEKYETISEKLHDQLGYKVGVISSVNLNHATPAAFYAHQESRSNYYDIGLEMVKSGFDYFAGGGLLKPTGEEKNKEDIYSVAKKAGYKVVKTQKEAEKLNNKSGKAIVIDEHLADTDSMSYEIDREKGNWSLANHVQKGIEVLDNGKDGFFMMVEGGKIDWACHANDATTVMGETRAFSDAVGKAIEFYNKHPEETLIVVTGDHETGGLTIGYSGTNYETFMQNLGNQKLSFQKFDDEYVTEYRKNKTDFDGVMKDITKLFGLKKAEKHAEAKVEKDSKDKHPTNTSTGSLELTDYEMDQLKAAYKKTMSISQADKDAKKEDERTQKEFELYGSYEPLTVTITHLLNKKSGIAFNSYSHTGLPVAVYAMGVGEDNFSGYYDNTDIYNKMSAIAGVK